MEGNRIRRSFLDYFIKNNHTEVASSSLIPENDPTLLFANAGMNQFKNVFTGFEARPYKRACSCQKVVRAGGKHNDLENVGRTARHHTFFEMLGNFSFGDYFKKEAINYAWEFLTVNMALPVDKLFITIYKDDDEAFDIWHKSIGLPIEKIIRKGEKDNFWVMGETGPCGPCSEILIDQGPDVGCKRAECNPDCDCDRHLELWNLVFMQFNRDGEGILTKLPNPCIDTGMGLERIAAITQNVRSNYETDLFIPIINFISHISHIKYNVDEKNDISLRVIADHARAATFLISDGAIPSNESRGYVLRRIMRRAMRYGRLLGLECPFLYEVCEYVADFMKDHYVELSDKKKYLSNIVRLEEERFSKILDDGLIIIDDLIDKYKSSFVLPGNEIFKLYDTYGFPVDLLEDIAKENNIVLDFKGFEKAMAKQKELARKGSKITTLEPELKILKDLKDKYTTKFIGYNKYSSTSTILDIIKDGKSVEILEEGQSGIIVLDNTPFYPEQGGQVGDTGIIKKGNSIAEISDTRKSESGIILHLCRVKDGVFSLNDQVVAEIDIEKRKNTENHHTGTHLLHSALRKILGEYVRQYGSMVADSYLRFDFNFNRSLTDKELSNIELFINRNIQSNLPVIEEYKSINDALNDGAIALFGEKYGGVVRVITIEGVSKELCGGCHVNATGHIGFFKILSESSVATGIRRIEAVCGLPALQYINNLLEKLKVISSNTGAPISDVDKKVGELIAENKHLLSEIKKLKEKSLMPYLDELIGQAKKIDDFYILAAPLSEVDITLLRNVMDLVKSKLKSSIILLYTIVGDRIIFLCGVTDNLTERFNADVIVKKVAKIAGGTGGGKKNLAQAGGKNIQNIKKAIEEFYFITEGAI